jgi:hypothetical protein
VGAVVSVRFVGPVFATGGDTSGATTAFGAGGGGALTGRPCPTAPVGGATSGATTAFGAGGGGALKGKFWPTCRSARRSLRAFEAGIGCQICLCVSLSRQVFKLLSVLENMHGGVYTWAYTDICHDIHLLGIVSL